MEREFARYAWSPAKAGPIACARPDSCPASRTSPLGPEQLSEINEL